MVSSILFLVGAEQGHPELLTLNAAKVIAAGPLFFMMLLPMKIF